MKNLTVLTLLYIILPTYFFLFSWVNGNYAVLCIIALTAALVFSIYKLPDENRKIQSPVFSLPFTLFSSSLISLLVCYFSEFGGFNYQSYDYQAHNFKFNLLATQPLPLHDRQRDIYMCYYLGYYIVPSLLGKITSIYFVKTFAFLWTWIGLSLSFSWIQIRLKHLENKQRLLICLLLVVGSYVSALLPALNKLSSGMLSFQNNAILINGKFVLNQLPVLSKSLSEAPQHTLPAVLGTCFLLSAITDTRYFYAFSVFLLSTIFWTPFTGVGLSLFSLYFFLKGFQEEKFKFVLSAALFGILLLLAFYPVLLFFLSSDATSMESNLFIWQTGSPYWPLYYLLYLFCFFGVWFVFFRRKLLEFDPALLFIAFLSFALIGLVQLGHFNDFNTRSSIASQIVLGLSIAYLVVVHHKMIFRKKLLVLGVLFWFVNSFSFLKFYYERLFILDFGPMNTIENTYIAPYGNNYYTFLEKGYLNGKEVVQQYSLHKGSVFERYLLKHDLTVTNRNEKRRLLGAAPY
jgi:hypothetical protein